jgi:hypothetical protein
LSGGGKRERERESEMIEIFADRRRRSRSGRKKGFSASYVAVASLVKS